MADRVIMPRALDSNGDIVPGATAYFYSAGTSSPLTVYADIAAATALGVTATADGAGVFRSIYTTAPVRLDVKDDAGISLPGYPSDDWHVTPPSGIGASQITFTPITGNTATTVSGAIYNNTNFQNQFGSFGLSMAEAASPSEGRDKLFLGGLATLDVLDEDDFASNSPARPPSQQSTGARITTRVNEIMGITGAAPAFAVRAYVSFGSTGNILASGNVASVTRNSVGNFTITFSIAMTNANYAVSGAASGTNATTDTGLVSIATDASGNVTNKTTTTCQVFTGRSDTGALADLALTTLTFVG